MRSANRVSADRVSKVQHVARKASALGVALAGAVFFAAQGGFVPSAGATTLLEDHFIDGGITNGTDALDTNWYVTKGAQTELTYRNDDNTTGPDEGADDGAIRHAPVNTTFAGYVGQFPSTTLNVGDSISLQFDYVTSDGTQNKNAQGLRFGLYNSNGSAANGTDLTRDDNDFGYLITVPTGLGQTGQATLYKESGTDGNAAGGTDLLSLSGSSTTLSGVAAAYVHYQLTITRDSLTQASFAVDVLGSPYTTPTSVAFTTSVDNSTPYFTFDEVLMSQGSITNGVHRADNFVVTLVPEPASIGLLAMGGVLLLRRRRLGC